MIVSGRVRMGKAVGSTKLIIFIALPEGMETNDVTRYILYNEFSELLMGGSNAKGQLIVKAKEKRKRVKD